MLSLDLRGATANPGAGGCSRPSRIAERTSVRYGPEAGEVTLGGRRVLAGRPCG